MQTYKEEVAQLANIGDVLADVKLQDESAVDTVRRLVRTLGYLADQDQPVNANLQHGPDAYQVPDGYESLMAVYVAALDQAANGKGHERHATPVPFERQKSCEIARRVGIAYLLGQAIKKAEESQRLGERGIAELYGAINYLAMACIIMQEQFRQVEVHCLVGNGM